MTAMAEVRPVNRDGVTRPDGVCDGELIIADHDIKMVSSKAMMMLKLNCEPSMINLTDRVRLSLYSILIILNGKIYR